MIALSSYSNNKTCKIKLNLSLLMPMTLFGKMNFIFKSWNTNFVIF